MSAAFESASMGLNLVGCMHAERAIFRLGAVSEGVACHPRKPSDAIEASARGMLRRPIGLLPSATTRAERTPERMGHVSVQVMRAAVQSCDTVHTSTYTIKVGY